jgi:processive 1,2-diacylglycerol beta-glucosyltransferase
VIRLLDANTGVQIGTLTEAQLQFLIDQLEEESDDDRDYYINAATLDMFAEAGADQALLDLLGNALGTRSEMDVRWER